MGIAAFIKSKCVETAVYWGNPQPDGYGGNTYDDPIELAPPDNGVRWEDKDQIMGTQVGGEVTGNVLLSRSGVVVNQDLDEQGYLYHGTLADLSPAQQANPKLIDDAYIIKRFEKTPALGSTTEFFRKAFLTPFLR